MKRKIFILLLILTLIPAVTFAAETVEFTLKGYSDYTSAYEVLEIINEERASQGIQPVSMNEELINAAMQRAAEIAFHYDSTHARPDGSECFSVLPSKFSNCAMGENIAAWQEDAEEVMNEWMNSDGHRENILNGSFNTVGIGCFYQKELGIRTWVQIFTSCTSGGYVRSGESEKVFTIKALSDRFDGIVAYNPSVSDNGPAYFTMICPGVTEEFRVLKYDEYYVSVIIEPENYTMKAESDNITVNGTFVTTVSEGVAELGFYMGDIKIGSHTFESGHDWYEYGFPATCTDAGYRSGICNVCGFEVEFERIPALGHDVIILPAVEPTCDEWGKTEGSYCGRCGIILVGQENVRNLGHKYVNEEIPPTCTEYGKIFTTCEVCDFYMESEGQAPLGHWWGDPCDDEGNYDRVTVCETCEYKEVYKKGYERLNSNVKSFMNIELKPTHEETVMKYKAIYDNFSDEYKAEFLYEEELNEMVRYFEFFYMGDVNRDGYIGAEDLSIILSRYSRQNSTYNIAGEEDIINSDDLSVILTNYGKER